MKTTLTLPSLLVLSSLVSCSTGGTLRYATPVNRMETPEVAGRWGGISTELSAVGTQQIELGKAHLPGSTYQFEKIQRFTPAMAAGFTGRLGIAQHLEAIVRARTQTTSMYGVKWQFKGTSRMERVRGWKMGAALLGGYSRIDSGESRQGNEYSSKIYSSAVEINYLLGFRQSEDLLWYGVTSYNYQGVKGQMSDRGATTLNVAGWSQQWAQTAGLEVPCAKMRCRFDAGVGFLNYHGRKHFTSGSGAFAVDFYW